MSRAGRQPGSPVRILGIALWWMGFGGAVGVAVWFWWPPLPKPLSLGSALVCPAVRPLAYPTQCECKEEKTSFEAALAPKEHFSAACVAWARSRRAMKQFETWQQECEQGNEASCALQGALYLEGIPGVLSADVPKGLQMLEAVCQESSWKTKEDREKRRFLCMGLAAAYAQGEQPVPKEVHKAVKLYQSFCNDEDTGSCSQLAGLYQTEPALASEAKQARTYAARACRGGTEHYPTDQPPIVGDPGEEGSDEEQCGWLGKEWLRKQGFFPKKEKS